MLTMFHSPQSRSTAITALLDEMGIADQIEIKVVSIPRMDGSGMRDTANPHPEGKVPALLHDGQLITERGGIILHLCGLFPESGMSPKPGTPEWGVFATWLTWYQGVLEPVMIHTVAGLSHPALANTFRGVSEATARLSNALAKGPWLMGDHYSAADLLVHSPFAFFKDALPEDPKIRDWVARCIARPKRLAAIERDLLLAPKAT